MEIENQVVSVEIAKELNEKLDSVNMVVDSAFYWVDIYGSDGVYPKIVDFKPRQTFYPSAHTLTEMLSMLPEYIDKESVVDGKLQTVRYNRVNSSRVVEYVYYPNPALRLDGTFFGFNSIGAYNCNEATACARLMVWLINNKYVIGGNNGNTI